MNGKASLSRVSLLALASVVAYLCLPGALAAVPRRSPSPDVRPVWSKGAGASEVAKNPNLSVLASPGYVAPENSAGFLEQLLETSDAGHGRVERQIRDEWSGVMAGYAARERHHLAGLQEEITVAQRSWSLGRRFLRSLFTTQVRDSLRKAEKKSDPVAVVAKAQKNLDFMANSGVNVSVGPQLQFGSRADVVNQNGRVWMNSPWLNGAVDFQLGFGERLPGEQYRVSVQRALPFEMTAGSVYGGSTRTMTTSLSRPLLPNLSCTLENRQDFQQSNGEQMARFNYQLRF